MPETPKIKGLTGREDGVQQETVGRTAGSYVCEVKAARCAIPKQVGAKLGWANTTTFITFNIIIC
jgi:hypothetical protein